MTCEKHHVKEELTTDSKVGNKGMADRVRGISTFYKNKRAME